LPERLRAQEWSGALHLPKRVDVIVRHRVWRADVSPDVDGEEVTRLPVAAAELIKSTAVRQRRR